MEKKNFRKQLVIGIIALFIGASVMSICNTYMDAELNYQINQLDAKDNSYAATADMPPISTGKNWTLMFYCCADNDLSGALNYFDFFSGSNLNVIALEDNIDGPGKIWYFDENNNTVLLEELGEVDMGDSATLKNFITYGKQNFSAERYMLIIFDHGGGWKGACSDVTNADALTMDEIKQALIETGGIDVIGFQACLMGAVESVYELKDCADVYIGCEEATSLWQYGIWDICCLLNDQSELSTIEIGQNIVQILNETKPKYEYYEKYPTFSAIRTDRIMDLVNAIDILCTDIFQYTIDYSTVQKAWELTKKFGDWQNQNKSFLNSCDIYDFVYQYSLLETNMTILYDLQNIKECINSSVIAEWHGSEQGGAHGLTIYFPQRNPGYNSRYDDPGYGLDFSQNTSWDEFLIDYYLHEDFYANQDIPVTNNGIINDYTATMDSDNVYEGVTEMESSGKPSNRYSYLEHKWTIDVTGGYESYVLHLEAYHTANSEGDDFIFAYSTDDTTYTDMITVTKTTDNNICQTFTLPDTLSGTVYIRVKDGDRTKGNRLLDTIYIDHMYIEAISEPDVTPPVISNVADSVSDQVWVNRAPSTAPLPRELHDMVYDAQADKSIMFGGALWYSPTRTDFGNDTWAYDYNNNTWTNCSPTISGSNFYKRDAYAMAYDSAHGVTILFGGQNNIGKKLKDTWEYNYTANTWTNLTPAVSGGTLPTNWYHDMVYLPDKGVIIMAFGHTGAAMINDTWEYNRTSNTWTKLSVTMPSSLYGGRATYSMAYDSQSGVVILHAGMDNALAVRNETYAFDYDTKTWTELDPTISGGTLYELELDMHRMVYDPDSDKIILFGGRTNETAANTKATWVFDYDANTWTKAQPIFTGGTFYRREATTMVYDTNAKATVLFGGWTRDIIDCTGNLNDTWVLISGNTQAIISWDTDEDSDSVVNYGTTTALGNTSSDSTMVTSHSILLTNILPDTTYYYEVQSTDASSNTATDNNNGSYYTFPDTTPPVISNVASSDITYNSARIIWDTDEPSNSNVKYGTTTPPTSTKSDSSMVTSHTITLTDLLPGTTYYYEVQSTDIKGNTAIDNNNSAYYTFTTASAPSNVMHVYSIDMWYQKTGKNYNIYTKVKIVDSSDNPVNGATVYIKTTLPYGGDVLYNGITGSDGTVTFMYGSTKQTGTYTSTVTNVVKTGWTYNPDSNVETSEHLQVP
ncbi:MAG: fibronectin type III domain-containing protein [Thermoplasmata archaeon]|nr:fibronectin type III domain-containing protein [Thermoplasmata archaeon]